MSKPIQSFESNAGSTDAFAVVDGGDPGGQGFGFLAQIATEVCDARAAAIVLVDDSGGSHTVAAAGDLVVGDAVAELCVRVVEAGAPLVIEDVQAESGSAASTNGGSHGVRFFASEPLRLADGGVAGALCVLDSCPRSPSRSQLERLAGLARQASALVELHHDECELERVRRRLDHEERLAHVAAWEWDARADAATWSQEMRLLLGIDEDFPANLDSFVELIHPEDRQMVIDTVGAAYDARSGFSYRARFVGPDGAERTLDTRGEVWLDDAGRRRGLVGATADVTNLVAAELRSRERADALRAAFETALDAFVVTDTNRRVIEVNRATSTMLGFSRDELLGKCIEDAVTGIDRETTITLWDAFVEAGHQRGELQLERRDGGEVTVEFSATANFVDGQHLVVLRDVTERRAAEAAVLEARTRLEETQALAQVGSWEWNLGSELQILSDELLRILGRPEGADPPSYEEFFEYLHPDDRDSYVAVIEQCMRTGEPFTQLFRLITELGETRWVESHGRLQRNERGEPVRMFGAAQDVTERERVAQNVRLQAEILDQLPIAVTAADPSGLLNVWNRAAEERFGVSRTHALGRHLDELGLIAPSSAEIRANMRERVGKGGSWEGEIELVDAAGESFPALVTNAPLHGPRGEVISYVGVTVDLTEQRKAELELRFQAQVLDQVQSAVIALDLDRRLTHWSRGAELLYGWTAEEVLGRSADELSLVGPGSGLTRKYVQDAVLETGHWEGEIEVRRKDGTTFSVLSRNALILDNEGNSVGMVGVSLDITERKLAEEEAREARLETIKRLARAVEKRDPETGGHSERIGDLAARLATGLGCTNDRVEMIRISSPMHDVGKIGIPDAILLKPGILTAQERATMERHTTIGHDILADSRSEVLDMAARIALSHHERIDGTGYPLGLSGDEIPLEGRIVAVADVFDALTSDRVYRPAFSVEKAIAIMAAERGTHFDERIFDLLVADLPAFVALLSDENQRSAEEPVATVSAVAESS